MFNKNRFMFALLQQREKGRMRFHALQNVELVLNFLRYKKVNLFRVLKQSCLTIGSTLN